MPQLNMFGSYDPTTITWTYSTNPLKPLAPSSLTMTAANAHCIIVESGFVRVNANVAYEEVASILSGTWDAYCFGEPDDMRQRMGDVHKVWKVESKRRPSL